MELDINKTRGIFIISLLLVFANFIFFPKLFLIHIFTAFYLFLIYNKFASNIREYLYFSTIVFALADTNLVFPIGSRYALYYYYVTLFIYILAVAYNFKTHKEDFKLKNKYFIFICVLLFYIVFSIFLEADKKIAVKATINYLIMFSFILMMIMENKEYKALKKSFNFFIWMYSGVVFLGTLEVFGIKYGARDHYSDLGLFVQQYPFLKRVPEVFFYNPNNYAVVLVLGMTALFIGDIFSEKTKNMWFYRSLFLISQVNLIFTTSRTAWITIFVVYFVAFIFFLMKKSFNEAGKTVKFGALTLLIFVIFSFIPSMTPYYGKFNSTPILRKLNLYNVRQSDEKTIPEVKVGDAGSINERLTLMVDVADGVIINKHYLGFGAGNIGNYIKYKDNTYGIYNIHNLWFEILGDFGVIIFLYFIYIYLNLILDLIKKKSEENHAIRKYSYMMALCLGAFILLAFGPSSVITFEPFWILMGLASAITVNNY